MRHAAHFTAPQLATLVDKPPAGQAWAHEIKLDGYRMIAWRDGASVAIYSRNGHDWTDRFPAPVKALLQLKCKTALVDGEIAIEDEKGLTSFARLQDAIARKTDLGIRYHLFDLLALDGEDLRAKKLAERKERLKAIIPKSALRLAYSDHIVGQGAKVFANACKLGLEGIISKRLDAPYTASRTLDWQKTKCLARAEFVVVGYSARTNAADDFGSLVLAAHENGKLVYAGNVGTGWNDRARRALYEKLVKLKAAKPHLPLPKGVSAAGITWAKPKLVVEVAFTAWTNDGLVRHPSFQGLREDKEAEDVVIERPAAVPGLKGGDWGRRRR